MKILGICGSVREGSFNRGLLRAAQEEVPEGVDIEMCLLGDIPLYNADVENVELPAPVAAFKEAIANADALLIACPEYNASFSGVLTYTALWTSGSTDRRFVILTAETAAE